MNIRAALLVMLVCFSVGTVSPAFAKTLKPAVYKKLIEVHKAYNEQAYNKALKQVNALLQNKLSGYARAQALQMLGAVQLAKESYAEALKAFSQAYQLKELEKPRQLQLLHNIAQLSYQSEQWQRSLKNFSAWQQTGGKPGANDYLMQAQAYSALENWAQVIPAARQAIALHKSPPDSWYQVQLVAHWRLKQFKQATDLLKVLVTRQPENAYFWQQLAYGYQQQNDDKSVLVTLRGAYVKGVLQSDKYVRWLAQLLIQEGSPQRAVEIIRESLAAKRLKNNRQTQKMLVQAYLLAKDYQSARPLLEMLAERAGSTIIYKQLAQVNMQLRRWQAAYRAYGKAITAHPDDAGQLYIMQGMASLNNAQLDKARQSFEQASEYPSAQDSANNWLSYIETLQKDADNPA
ncbi:tetratricopeptide repeat protein [Aliamphritea ceti]|uniref:tetratricopeptide repeat protein n=1 Tax=Aliamphritea ceti TaxID=1524258 RepID=UPI0021C3F5A1|nr:tetratricopeptide repeat protein [Aliamphritea ceti]